MTMRYTLQAGPAGDGADARDADSLAALCDTLAGRRDLRPFDPQAMAFCARVSKRLLRHPGGRQWPQIVTLGYWLRPAALSGLAASYPARDGVIRVPRGLAFHLPPANVDTIFVYSWILSVLAGNPNLVRLPSELNPVAALLLDVVREEWCDAIRSMNAFVSYGRDDALSAVVSERCAARVVWGGDAKVRQIRAIPLPPNAIDLNFANRFSIAAILTEAYLALPDGAALELADKFYNDVYWFDQMGCASPRIVHWVGTAAAMEGARQRFYRDLETVVGRRGYGIDVGVAVAKLSFSHRAILDHDVVRLDRFGPAVTALALGQVADVRGEIQGGGMLYDVAVPDLATVAQGVRREDQTLTAFGFTEAQIEAFVLAANGRGIDRIVPFGRALDFGHVWDGWDLIESLTRLVTTR